MTEICKLNQLNQRINRKLENTLSIEGLEARRMLSALPGATLDYSSFLGGNSIDPAFAVAIDGQGSTYVTGSTGSTNYPGTAGAFDSSVGGIRDAFVAKFNPNGTLAWSTYLGGAGEERAHGIAVDGAGNVYVTGRTNSADFPTTPGSFDATFNGEVDAFVTKLSADGTHLLYSTYLGGSGFEIDESFDEQARTLGGIALDAAGQAYITGITTSTNFPTTAGAFDTDGPGFIDVFVSKLNAVGSELVYSTFLGGSDIDRAHEIVVDTAGNAYVTGEVVSSDFPTTAGAFQPNKAGGFSDAFVTKINPAGSALVYSSYLGGTGSEFPGRMAVDTNGAAYLTGATASFDFPTTPGAFQPVKAANGSDAYVTKVSPDGSAMVYSTHLGGSFGDDAGSDIAVDERGQAYVVGGTSSGTFPLLNHFQGFAGIDDTFITKFNTAGSALIYSSYLGGGRTDTGYGIAVDANHTAHVVGQTNSSGQFSTGGFPTTPDAFQPTFGGGANDAFVARIVSDDIAPVVNSAEFAFDAGPQSIRFTFSENVSASLSATDLQLENLTTGQTIPSGNIAVSYDAGLQTATFTFPGYPSGALPDGNYRATLAAAGVSDASGNMLSADYTTTFFVLAGDANRDRSIDIEDFAIVAGRFNQPGTFTQGDFNYDGTTDIGDFAILTSKFNTSLPAAQAIMHLASPWWSKSAMHLDVFNRNIADRLEI